MHDKINLRHIRAFTKTAEYGSISGASRTVFLSQPAITQAIAKLETTLGCPLFVRSHDGMYANEAGKLFARRAGRMLELLAEGARKAFRTGSRDRGSGFRNSELLFTTIQLRAFNAICATGNFTWAASETGASRPSIHKAINDLERICGFPLIERTAQGYEPTPAGAHLNRSALLAFSELKQGMDEVSALNGRETGHIDIGSLPLARSQILPEAINRIATELPNIRIKVRDGPYFDLLHALRFGEIDFIIGALRSPAPIEDVVQTRLFTDRLAIVARAGHPLQNQRDVGIETLSGFPWVVPAPAIPTRIEFERLFAGTATGKRLRFVESSSQVLMRGLLAGSDRLAIISRHQVQRDLDEGLLVEIEFRLKDAERAIGITTRDGWRATAAQQRFIDLLHEVCASLP